MLDSMHLTEITRIGAVITKQTATNASHPSVIRLLSRITIGILYENNCNVLRKPLISLAQMILWPTMYIEGDLDPDNPSFAYSKESRSELKAAQLIARDILQHNNISVAKIEPTMKAWEEGRWLADDRDVAWNAPGTAVVAIPDRPMHAKAGVKEGYKMLDLNNYRKPKTNAGGMVTGNGLLNINAGQHTKKL
ncbi:hypothetical protein BC835DRAFT_1311415 [Cytidiella melzeri]|nr:hypothetical protein BC835DRAFT_1311415 [Cytidiella melzeri]